MTKETARQYLPLVIALSEGKTIQIQDLGIWYDTLELNLQFPASHYRIKPEPREVYLGKKPDGSFADYIWFDKDHASMECGPKGWTPTLFREVLP